MQAHAQRPGSLSVSCSPYLPVGLQQTLMGYCPPKCLVKNFGVQLKAPTKVGKSLGSFVHASCSSSSTVTWLHVGLCLVPGGAAGLEDC